MITLEKFIEKHFGDWEDYQLSDYRVDCPFCPDHKKKMYINRSTGVYHCWKCGSSGTFNQLRVKLPEKFHNEKINLNKKVKREKREVRDLKGMPAGFKKFAQLPKDKVHKHRGFKYLTGRGITPSTIFKYELGYTLKGRFKKRIIVPVIHQGKVVSYLGRDYSGNSPKKVLYDTKENSNPVSMFLYNYDKAKEFKSVIVTEGWTDCLAVVQRVGDRVGVVATFGKNMTKEQIDLLIDGEFEEIIFMWDQDAFDTQLNFISWLDDISEVYYTKLGEEDPAEMSEDQFFRVLKGRTRFTEEDLLKS